MALLPALVIVSACAKAEPSACDGFANRRLGVTGEEYRPCASEILAALDALEPPLRAVVEGRAAPEQKDEARRAYARVRRLIRSTGVGRDFIGDSGTVAVKWPERAVREFNSAVFHAAAQYGSALGYPNPGNFGQGLQAHEDARRYYDAIR